MLTYKELLLQRQALDQELAEMHVGERAAALAEVRTLIEAYGLTERDLRAPRTLPILDHARGWRDPKSGRTWSGEGPPPAFLGSMKRVH